MFKININKLKCICNAQISELMNCLDVQGDYAFQDNGSNILAVAHLDTVLQETYYQAQRYARTSLIFSPRLDDRLGVYTILHELPRRNINVDILFTIDEEIISSTAQHFIPQKEYNWIVEFDRMGTDVVTYNYDWDYILDEFFTLGWGSYSDIVELTHVGCMALNVGIGYHNPHSIYSYCREDEYYEQLNRFEAFYSKHKDIKYPYNDVFCCVEDVNFKGFEFDGNYL